MTRKTMILPQFLKIDLNLNKLYQSRVAAFIVAHIEYLFKKYPDGFSMFLEPCDHLDYQQGESWCELIHTNRKTFTQVFDRIGIRYRSKTAYKIAAVSGDPFCGKRYLCYYDRNLNQMYYLRNNNRQELLSNLN